MPKQSEEAERSGTSTNDIEKGEEKTKEFAFLMWLVPFIMLRVTKSNLPSRSTEVDLPCSIVADCQSVTDEAEIEENIDMEDEANNSDGEHDILDDELEPLELPAVSRKMRWIATFHKLQGREMGKSNTSC